MSSPINSIKLKQFVPQKFCLECVGCCRFIDADSKWSPVCLKQEVNLLKNRDSGQLRDKSPRPKLIASGGIFICQFLRLKKNKCGIYIRRPFDCRLYPFLINKSAGKIFLSVHLNCPYIEQNISGKKFHLYKDYLLKFLSLSKTKRTIQDNSQIISNFKDKEIKNIAELKI